MLLGNTLHLRAKNTGASGASVITSRNRDLLLACSSSIIDYQLELTLSNPRANWRAIFFELNLLSKDDFKNVTNCIKTQNIQTVFIDTSLFGNLAKSIKRKFPFIRMIAFFHNVEFDYFKELIKVTKKKRHYLTAYLVKKAEKELIENSDVIISLNNRDSISLKKHYGKSADLILPTSFNDVFDESKFTECKNNNDILSMLFVGSYFPPNIFAIDWFINNVLPNIKRDVELYVIGNGFEKHTLKVENSKIYLIGRVEDLSNYYYKADLVIAPIFHGSGMKTKVAEALMYNKPVVGTKEAFEGYDIDITCVGALCNTATEYVDFIEKFSTDDFYGVRQYFVDNYSSELISAKFLNFCNDKNT